MNEARTNSFTPSTGRRVLRRELKILRARITNKLRIRRYNRAAINGLDLKLEEFLPDTGVFLEVGANDGISQSNTFYLERVKRWRGILIEPLPSLFRRCERLRKNSVCFNNACVEPGNPNKEVQIVDMNLMSVLVGQQESTEESARLAKGKINGVVNVKATTISELIDRSGFDVIDFMSIDVEGGEIPLLNGLDLDRHCPSWMLIETKVPDDVSRLLEEHMELRTYLSHHDLLFERKVRADR